MSFIESYKHLDKICGEMFETQYGVSAYIEEMINTPPWFLSCKRLGR